MQRLRTSVLARGYVRSDHEEGIVVEQMIDDARIVVGLSCLRVISELDGRPRAGTDEDLETSRARGGGCQPAASLAQLALSGLVDLEQSLGRGAVRGSGQE